MYTFEILKGIIQTNDIYKIAPTAWVLICNHNMRKSHGVTEYIIIKNTILKNVKCERNQKPLPTKKKMLILNVFDVLFSCRNLHYFYLKVFSKNTEKTRLLNFLYDVQRMLTLT